MQNPSSPKSRTFQCSLGFLPISWTFLLYPVPTVGESRVRHSACCSLCAKLLFYDSIWSLSPNPTILVMIPTPIFCPDLPCSSRLYVQMHLECLVVVVVVVVFSLNVAQVESSPSLSSSRSILLLFIWVVLPVSTQCPRLGVFFDPLLLQHQAVAVLPSPPPPPPPPSSYL